jgi:hypothetical protein
MNGKRFTITMWFIPCAVVLLFTLGVAGLKAPAAPNIAPPPETRQPDADENSTPPGGEKDQPEAKERVPLEIELPKPAFKGTPKHVPPGSNLEKPRSGPRPPFLVPKGVKNVSQGKPVTSSDDDPIIGSLKLVTDSDKGANEGCYVELGPGTQYVQIDLQKEYEVYALLVWHYHGNARVYHDVIVQASTDKDFILGVQTLFNDDHDNSSGLGVGRDKEYWDTYEGRLIDGKGVKARYVRLYSNGSTADDMNHYTEVEVFALPASP